MVDGHDTEAAIRAARWAHDAGIPVVADLDNLYPGVQALLEYVNFAVTSSSFPEKLTGESDLLRSLPQMLREFKCRLVAATLGRLGVIAWDGAEFTLCRGFRVRAVDTTGASDVFHGAFVYGLVQGSRIKEILEFSCAAAALNCMALGARGGIATLPQIAELRRSGARSELAYLEAELTSAARDAAETRGVSP